MMPERTNLRLVGSKLRSFGRLLMPMAPITSAQLEVSREPVS